MLSLIATYSKYIDATLKDEKPGWYYLGRFVFNGRKSDGRITINVPGIAKDTPLLLYSDANTDWSAVWKSRKDCKKVSSSKYATKIITKDSQVLVIEKTPAPSFWYLAIANCDKNVNTKGQIHLEDLEWNEPSLSYNTEFDFSEQDEIEVTTAFTLLFGALFMQQLYNFFMKMRPGRHMFVHLVTISTGLQCIGYVVRLIWCTQYAQTGKGYAWQCISNLLVITADVLMVLIALFIGQGYLISYPQIQHKAVTWSLFGVTAGLAFSMAIYCIVVRDDPVYAYNLETIPGILYNISRMACAAFFTYTILTNRMKETYRERKALYLVLFIIYLCVLAGPFVSFCFAFIYPRWFRETNVLLMTRMLDFVAVVVIVYLTNPDSIADNFRVQGIVTVSEPKMGGLKQGENSEDSVEIKLPDFPAKDEKQY
ncbi:Rhodopsin-like_GPCR transmembrane domain-containing protein [Hexamita inflata]|uniref:Rhodopsin-like GPCR transmembrane domain-containing protein n=1 Tax=Hexamita inflata TaxID=28002 RepID=A0AA86P2W4_9EUKA|nr:Rhodopsin-like GPCR transmembrane domain-containing protein [Hexamita inflata]